MREASRRVEAFFVFKATVYVLRARFAYGLLETTGGYRPRMCCPTQSASFSGLTAATGIPTDATSFAVPS